MPKPSQPFAGFRAPNTTPVPDQLFDELLTVLTGNELKVVLYIIRRTFGFKKQSDNISLNQMLKGIVTRGGRVLDRGVGLSKPTLLKVLKVLVEKEIVLKQRRSDRVRGNLSTCYQLKLADTKPEVVETTSEPLNPPLGKKPLPRVGKNLLPRLGKAALPRTRNRETRNRKTNNNVVKTIFKSIRPRDRGQPPRSSTKPLAQVDYLVDEIEKATGDRHSRGGFAQIAQILPDHETFQLLSELKQSPDVKNKGAWFMARAKKHWQKPKPT